MYAANSLVRLPQSIFGVAVSVAILPTLARAAARKDLQEIRVTLMEGLRETYYLILPAMLGLVALNEPIIRLLFQHGSFTPLDTRNTAAVLGLFAWGLLAFAWIKVAVTGFYADKRTGPPVIVASISMALNIVLIFAFKDWLGFRGLALATTISYSVNFIGLYVLLCRRYGNLWDAPFVNALWRITAAGVAMALATGAARAGLEQTFSVDTVPIRCVIVFVPMALAVAVYLACCQILKVSEQEYFVSLLNRNKMKSPSDSSDDKDKRK
jgi:putative peptidoglycan lipid II flippase